MNLSDAQKERIEYLLYEAEDENQFLSEFNKIATKEELHELAQNINWDGGYFELEQIISHPNIDRGTALLLYWYGEPQYFTKYSSAEEVEECNRQNYIFIKKVERMLLENDFKSNEIPFNPVQHLNMNLIQQKKLKGNLGIPESLKVANVQA